MVVGPTDSRAETLMYVKLPRQSAVRIASSDSAPTALARGVSDVLDRAASFIEARVYFNYFGTKPLRQARWHWTHDGGMQPEEQSR